MGGFLFDMWIIGNIIFIMSEFESRFNMKCLTRLDYLLMTIFFPMTIILAVLYAITKTSEKLAGNIAKKNITKNFWVWLNESPSKEKKKA